MKWLLASLPTPNGKRMNWVLRASNYWSETWVVHTLTWKMWSRQWINLNTRRYQRFGGWSREGASAYFFLCLVDLNQIYLRRSLFFFFRSFKSLKPSMLRLLTKSPQNFLIFVQIKFYMNWKMVFRGFDSFSEYFTPNFYSLVFTQLFKSFCLGWKFQPRKLLTINTTFVWILPFSPKFGEMNVQFIEQPEVQKWWELCTFWH